MENVKVRFKKLHPDAIVPKYATAGAVACDLYSTEEVTIPPGHLGVLPTGIVVEIPVGFEGQVRPRSSQSKNGHHVKLGTIDADYRGQLMVMLDNVSAATLTLEPGDRIAQLVISPCVRAEFEETSELTETARAGGGFGSTGVR